MGKGRAGLAHPRPAAGSTAACTAASCSPTSARRRRLRCLPKPGGRAALPATAPARLPPPPLPPGSGRGTPGSTAGEPGRAVPARKAPMPFMKAWDWQAAYCCSACGDTLSAGHRHRHRPPTPPSRYPHPRPPRYPLPPPRSPWPRQGAPGAWRLRCPPPAAAPG